MYYDDTEELMIATLDKYYIKNIIEPYKKSDKLIDMHMHSDASDGELSAFRLVQHCIDKKIGIMSITDHDTVEGLKSLNGCEIIKDTGIIVIPGIEMTASIPKGRMHILGYGIDIYNKELNNKLLEMKDNSVNSVLSVIEQIKRDNNIRFNSDDIKELFSAKRNIGRPDVAALCVKYGYAKSYNDAFKKYLIDAYDKVRPYKKSFSYQEIIEIILNANGIPVLAHPNSLELNEKEFLLLLKKMIECGLLGIECYHSSYTNKESNYYLNIAEKYGLLVSGGTDYHGKKCKPNIEVGVGKGNIKIKELSLLKKLDY